MYIKSIYKLKVVPLVASASATITEDDADCLASVSGEQKKCYDFLALDLVSLQPVLEGRFCAILDSEF